MIRNLNIATSDKVERRCSCVQPTQSNSW